MTRWHPIETAPKSASYPAPGLGSYVKNVYLLGFCPEDGARDPQSCISVIWWEPHLGPGGRGCWYGDGEHEYHPTHWIPLPAAPKGELH